LGVFVLRSRLLSLPAKAAHLPTRRSVTFGAVAGLAVAAGLPAGVQADGGHKLEPEAAISVSPAARPSFTEHNLDADIGHLFHFLIANEGKVVDLDLRLSVESGRNGSNHHQHKNNRNIPNHNYLEADWIVMTYTRRNMRARLIVYHSRDRNLPPGYFGFRGPFEVQNEFEFEFADFDINRLPKGYKGFYLSPAGYPAPR
jgi:hypothetical protein